MVDVLQVGELGGVGTDTSGDIGLIEVDITNQVVAVSSDIAYIQREVGVEGVLHAEAPIPDIGGFEMRVHAPQAARRGDRAREHGPRRKNNAIPVERRAGDKGAADQNRAAKGLRTGGSDGHGRRAGARRDVGDAGSWDVRYPGVPRERSHAEHRVKDAASGPDHGCTLARDIPGNTEAWREIFSVGLPESRAYARLTLLHHS